MVILSFVICYNPTVHSEQVHVLLQLTTNKLSGDATGQASLRV